LNKKGLKYKNRSNSVVVAAGGALKAETNVTVMGSQLPHRANREGVACAQSARVLLSVLALFQSSKKFIRFSVTSNL
jgi:hypothetical protein